MQEEVLRLPSFDPIQAKMTKYSRCSGSFTRSLTRKGYSRDELYRDAKDDRYFNLRYWNRGIRRHAYDDPTSSNAG